MSEVSGQIVDWNEHATGDLRFQRRRVPCIDPGFFESGPPTMDVLQQLWVFSRGGHEWRDVPTVDEEGKPL